MDNQCNFSLNGSIQGYYQLQLDDVVVAVSNRNNFFVFASSFYFFFVGSENYLPSGSLRIVHYICLFAGFFISFFSASLRISKSYYFDYYYESCPHVICDYGCFFAIW